MSVHRHRRLVLLMMDLVVVILLLQLLSERHADGALLLQLMVQHFAAHGRGLHLAAQSCVTLDPIVALAYPAAV